MWEHYEWNTVKFNTETQFLEWGRLISQYKACLEKQEGARNVKCDFWRDYGSRNPMAGITMGFWELSKKSQMLGSGFSAVHPRRGASLYGLGQVTQSQVNHF